MRADEAPATLWELKGLCVGAMNDGLERLAQVLGQMWADRKMAMLLKRGLVTPEEAGYAA